MQMKQPWVWFMQMTCVGGVYADEAHVGGVYAEDFQFIKHEDFKEMTAVVKMKNNIVIDYYE